MGFMTKMIDDENDEDNDVLGKGSACGVGGGESHGRGSGEGLGRVWVKRGPVSQTLELGFYPRGSRKPGEDFKQERQMMGSVVIRSYWRLG